MANFRHNPVFRGQTVDIEYFIENNSVYMAKLPDCEPCRLTDLSQIARELSLQGAPQCSPSISNWLVKNGYGQYVTAYSVKAGERSARNAQMLMLDIKNLYQYLIEHPVQNEYIACINCEAVREVEYDTKYCSEPESKNWTGTDTAEIFIGVFAGDEDSAIEQAAKLVNTDPRNIILYPI